MFLLQRALTAEGSGVVSKRRDGMLESPHFWGVKNQRHTVMRTF